MNKFGILTVALMALAACGGGASSGGQTPPTPTPPSYTAQIVFVGPLDGHAIQADLHRAYEHRMTSGTATPLPIMVLTADNSSGSLESSNVTDFGGTLQVQASPAPSSSPTVVLADTNSLAAISSPAPTSYPAGVIDEAFIAGNASAANEQAAGTVTATISAPVNQTPTTAVYAYTSISLECQTPANTGSAPAWTYSNGSWSPATSIASADIYLTGPKCPGVFYSTTPDPTYATLNVPGGGLTLSTDTPYCSLTASQWTNSATQFDMETLDTLNPDGSANTEVLGKTRSGAIFKLFPNIFGPYPGDISGAVEVSGNSIDGF